MLDYKLIPLIYKIKLMSNRNMNLIICKTRNTIKKVQELSIIKMLSKASTRTIVEVSKYMQAIYNKITITTVHFVIKKKRII